MSDRWIVKALVFLHRWFDAGLANRLRCRLQASLCAHGRHGGDDGYCAYGCGTLLNGTAWRRWSVVLQDGATVVDVMATNETHARCKVVFGEHFYERSIAQEGCLLHPDNIRSCRAHERDAAS